MILKLKRFYKNINYTLGILTIENNNIFFTLELPYRNNERFISCIEEGEYVLTKYNSNKFKNCFKINDVKDRSDILIHTGNAIENTSGCILIGNGIIKDDDNGIRLSDSRKALNKLNEIINNYNNDNFNSPEFRGIKNEVGSNRLLIIKKELKIIIE